MIIWAADAVADRMRTKTEVLQVKTIDVVKARLASYLRSDGASKDYRNNLAWTNDITFTWTGNSMVSLAGATYRATIDEKTIGKIMLWELNPSSSSCGKRSVTAFLTDFWVKKSLRCNGVGTMLLGIVETVAFNNGIKYTLLHADKEEGLTRFYLRRGYGIVNYKNGFNLFMKDLEASHSKLNTVY